MKGFILKAVALGLLLAACIMLWPQKSHAAESPLKVYAGANAAWLDGPGAAFPVDAEIGGSASESLSPHISLVGGAWYGFSHSYIRYSAAARITATDVNDPNFNIFLDAGLRGGSTGAVGPTEFAPGAGFGWRPDPSRWPNVTIVGDASYGSKSSRALVYLGARYQIPLK